MAGEKYIVATLENSIQIAVRNILNPVGYTFLGNCSDSVSLMRLIRSYQPDLVVVDTSLPIRELKSVVDTIDEEMLCACILIGEYRNMEIGNLLEKSKTLSCCPKPINRDILLQVVEMGVIGYRRISELDRKLKEMTENYETRKLVERAKWILIQRDGISENEAYDRMRKKSMDTRVSMKAIAEAIIFTYDMSQGNKAK